MAGDVLDASTVAICAHGGSATPAATSLRVRTSGGGVVSTSDAYVISGCPFAPPCVTGRWLAGANRMKCEGQASAVAGAASICEPTGAPMIVVSGRSRVRAG